MHIVAHQGGWDEALFVVGPLLLIVALLRLAKRRASRGAMAPSGSAVVHGEDDVERRAD